GFGAHTSDTRVSPQTSSRTRRFSADDRGSGPPGRPTRLCAVDVDLVQLPLPAAGPRHQIDGPGAALGAVVAYRRRLDRDRGRVARLVDDLRAVEGDGAVTGLARLEV